MTSDDLHTPVSGVDNCEPFTGLATFSALRERVRLNALCAFVLLSLTTGSLASTVNLPWIKQKSLSDCGRAVLAALGAERNGGVEKAYDLLPAPSEQGYSLPEMVTNAAKLSLKLAPIAPPTILDCTTPPGSKGVKLHFGSVSQAVKNGAPVIVLTGLEKGLGHYLILVGVTSGGFVVQDPSKDGTYDLENAALAATICASGFLALRVD